MGSRWIFDGHIAGIGTGSGLRAVVGIWNSSPFGPFSDVMVQEPSGHRLLLAPSEEVADFISDTYSFDEVRVLDVNTTLARDLLTVDAGALSPIVPAVEFGFSSVPPRPSLARVRTTVVDTGAAGETSPFSRLHKRWLERG
jgi:hypothetical protein